MLQDSGRNEGLCTYVLLPKGIFFMRGVFFCFCMMAHTPRGCVLYDGYQVVVSLCTLSTLYVICLHNSSEQDEKQHYAVAGQ